MGGRDGRDPVHRRRSAARDPGLDLRARRPRAVLLALAHRRESLNRLRSEPRCALAIVAGGFAVTAHATATILRDLDDAVVAVRLDVEEIQDHGQPTFAIEAGVRWRWLDDEARARDARIRAALRELS